MNLHDFTQKIKAFQESDNKNDTLILTMALEALHNGVDPLDLVYATSSAATNRYMLRQLCEQGRINEIPAYRLIYYPEYIIEFGMQCEAHVVSALRARNADPYMKALLNQYTNHRDTQHESALLLEQWRRDIELNKNKITEDVARTFCDRLQTCRDYLQTVTIEQIEHVERLLESFFYLSSHDVNVIASDFRREPALTILQTLIHMTPALQTFIKRRRWKPEHIAVMGVDNVYAPGHSIKEWVSTGNAGIDYLKRHKDILLKLNIPKRETLMLRGPGEFAFIIDFLKALGPLKAGKWLEKYQSNLWVTEIGLWLPREHVKSEFHAIYDQTQTTYKIQESMMESCGKYYVPMVDYCLHQYQDYFLFDMKTEINGYFDVKTSKNIQGRTTPLGNTFEYHKEFWDDILGYLTRYNAQVPVIIDDTSPTQEADLFLG